MTTIPTRTLGALTVPAIGYGAMVLSPGMYGPIDDATALRALRHAVDAGATLIDTADGYGAGGHNETLVGRAVAGRDDVLVATKFGFNLPEGVPAHRFGVGYAFGDLAVNGEPRHVRRFAEASLRRLGRDAIDLYYPHFPDPVVPIEETVGAVGELVRDGLVRHVGVSNVTADELRRAHAAHPVAAVQYEWSLWRPIEPDLLAAADELGVGIVAWSPLGAGFLTGAVRQIDAGDFRANAPRFDAANLAANNDRYAPIRALAADLALTPGQLALAWLLHRHPHVVPIPGSRNPAHIDENLHAARVALDAGTLRRVDEAVDAFAPSGATLL
jgi:aryl-alcohol dehydrogenase-like predicted oxidoreductase